MKPYNEIYDYCVKQVCEYYATHRDLSMSAAGVMEAHEVECVTNVLMDPNTYEFEFVTKAADGMLFRFTVNDHYDATKITMNVYRAYDVPREVIM